MTSSVKSAGCGEVNRTRSSPSISPHARSSLREAQPVAELHAVGVDVLAEQGHLDARPRRPAPRPRRGRRRAGGPSPCRAAPGRCRTCRCCCSRREIETQAAYADSRRVGRVDGKVSSDSRISTCASSLCRARSSSTGSEPMLWVPKTTSTHGRPRDDLAAVLLRQAAADGDLHAGPRGLDRRQVAEVAVEPVVGVLAHRAGVEHDDVGRARRRAPRRSPPPRAGRTAARSRARSSGTRRCGPRRCARL